MTGLDTEKQTNDKQDAVDQLLIESKISEQMVLEHPTYKQLEDKLLQAEQKSQEHWNNWLLAQAETENLKRRTEREIANIHKYSLEKFALEILTVVDNLERSLTTMNNTKENLKDFYTGIELTLKSLLETLQKFGITQIDPTNELFDHEKHTAVSTKEDPKIKSNTILEVIQKGYWIKDRLLRPALVVVAK